MARRSGRPAVRQGYPRHLASSIASSCGSHRGGRFVCRTGMLTQCVETISLVSWRWQPLCAAAKQRNSRRQCPPVAPALAEVAAAVASFSSCPRFFATSLSCSALAFREAGGSRPRQSEPSSSVLPAGVQGLDAVKFFGRAPRRSCSALGGYRTGLQ